MTKEQCIIKSKEFRVTADNLLQQMKEHRVEILRSLPDNFEDISETISQHTLSIRDLESCIMRQGMTLKYIGNPSPYPNSYNTANAIVEPTADGLKL